MAHSAGAACGPAQSRERQWSVGCEAVVPLPSALTRLCVLSVHGDTAQTVIFGRSRADEMEPLRYIHWVNATGQ